MNFFKKLASIVTFFMTPALFAMETPFFTGDSGAWSRADVEKILNVSKKRDEDQYKRVLQIAASGLAEQDEIFKFDWTAAYNFQDQYTQVCHEATDLLCVRGEKSTYKGREATVIDLKDLKDDAWIALFTHKDLLETPDILSIRSEENARTAISFLKNFPNEKVQHMADVFAKRLEASMVKRESKKIMKQCHQISRDLIGWEDFGEQSKIASYRKLLPFKQNYLTALKAVYILTCEKQNIAEAVNSFVPKYCRMRPALQQLYSFLIAELKSLNYCRYFHPNPSDDGGLTEHVGKEEFEGASVLLPGCEEKPASTTTTVITKKKRKKHKSKVQLQSNSSETLPADEDALEETLTTLDVAEDLPVEQTAPAFSETVRQTAQPQLENKPSLSDSGLRIIEDTYLWVKLFDQAKDVVWCIYKMPNPSVPQNFHYRYSSRVSLWLSDSSAALNKAGYDDEQSYVYKKAWRKRAAVDQTPYRDKDHLCEMMALFHSVDPDCDTYIKKYGKTYSQKRSVENQKRDILCTVVTALGHCEYKGERMYGLFSLVVDDSNHYCFHRMFEPKNLDCRDSDSELYKIDLDDEDIKHLYNIDMQLNFPPMSLENK